jgi:bis(5'-nucleosidyl)-tetraphosphatase
VSPHRAGEPVLAAGVVVARLVAGEPRFLLLRAYNYWDFPKGELEADEEPLAAARRETAEETGLHGLTFRWGEGYRETEPYRGGRKVARYYLAESPEGEVKLPVSPELGRPEHHEARWAAYGEARDLLVPRLQEVLDWAQSRLDASAGGAEGAEEPEP